MTHAIVDERKCRLDGHCVAVCPVGIIEIKEGKRVPTPVEGSDALCINCGHCVAVCPEGAMSLDTMAPDDCPDIQREWLLSPEQAEHFLRTRRSTRVYREKPVEKELLSRLISIARYAPSGHNMQPVQWFVVHDTGELKRLTAMVVDWMRNVLEGNPQAGKAMLLDRIVDFWDRGSDTVSRGAPHLVFTHAPEGNPVAPSASTIALAYLELAAPSLGLGACWAGYTQAAAGQWPPLKEALGLPEGHVSTGAMMVGQPRYRYHRLPTRREPSVTWR
jgi:nitroreductase/NAD-dependent dihydropyrimidine dehydrogenase PreA subunit